MESIRSIMEDVRELSTLIADAVILRTAPVQDDLSERQASHAYGARWLQEMKRRGLADYSRIGGKVVYSRHQLDCLRAAERQHAKLLLKEIG